MAYRVLDYLKIADKIMFLYTVVAVVGTTYKLNLQSAVACKCLRAYSNRDRQSDGMKPGSWSRAAKSRDGTGSGLTFREFPGSGTGFGKTEWDRDAPLDPGYPKILPDLF